MIKVFESGDIQECGCGIMTPNVIEMYDGEQIPTCNSCMADLVDSIKQFKDR